MDVIHLIVLEVIVITIRNDSTGNALVVLPSGEVHVGYGTEIVSTGYKFDVNGSVNSASGGYSIAGTSVLSSYTREWGS